MQQEMICIICPVGCRMTVEKDGESIRVTGNTCKRGERYAAAEFTNPVRVVTSSVFVDGGHMPLVSVRTAGSIPKGDIGRLMDALKTVRLQAPVRVGDVVLADAVGSGVNVIATRDIRAQ